MKLLKVFNSIIEAEIVKGLLKSHKIKSWIFSDDAGMMYPSQDLVNGVKLMVDNADWESANALLWEMEIDIET